jgi:hypothetical protein
MCRYPVTLPASCQLFVGGGRVAIPDFQQHADDRPSASYVQSQEQVLTAVHAKSIQILKSRELFSCYEQKISQRCSWEQR